MQKIISLFQRNYDGDHLVRDELVPGTEWVAAGEGVATRKWDGTCCLVRDGKLFKRYELRRGRPVPEGFEAATDWDEVTGKMQGWVPVGDGPEDRWHREGWMMLVGQSEYFGHPIQDGTYELIGPKIQGGVELSGVDYHLLMRHGRSDGILELEQPPRTFHELRAWLAENNDIEGIVWHHPDGRMVKIKLRDFGIKRRAR